MKKAVRKVADTLRKLNPLFGSADLANAIEESKLFNGIVYDDGNGSKLVLNSDNSWTCNIGYARLTFDKDGQLVHIEPKEYVDEVLNLCNIIWFVG